MQETGEILYDLPGEPGYYVLVIVLHRRIKVVTRGGREFELVPGTYVYIGSALGRGGIKARVKRHLKRAKKLWWHIDYVTSDPAAEIAGVVSLTWAERDMESLLSERLAGKLVPIKGFGNSDKRDPSHLFYCPGMTPDDCIDVVEKEAFILMTGSMKKYVLRPP